MGGNTSTAWGDELPSPDEFGVAGVDPFAAQSDLGGGVGSTDNPLSSLMGNPAWKQYALYGFIAVAAIVILRKVL